MNSNRRRMRISFVLWLCVGAFVLAAVPAAAACTNDDGMLAIYQGTIGARSVRATFAFHGSTLRGQISAGHDSTDVPVYGGVNRGSVVLYAAATHRPVLHALLTNCSKLNGTWTDSVSGAMQPIRLTADGEIGGSLAHRYDAAGASNAAAVDARVRAFRAAIVAGDRRAVSTYVSYPLRVNSDARVMMISNQAMLLARYDRIFTPSVRAAIARAVPADLFSRDQGIMLGSGVVWFDPSGKAIAINQL